MAADELPELEIAFVHQGWTDDTLPGTTRWTSLSKDEQDRIRAGENLILLRDTWPRRFRRVQEYDCGLYRYQTDWHGDSYIGALVRPVGPSLVVTIYADHMQEFLRRLQEIFLYTYYIYICMCIYIYMYVYVCIYIYIIYMYLCHICVYVCIYLYISHR